MPSPIPPAVPSDVSGVGRRAVLRTGATLAWTVPAVTLVTAAPAFATSGTPTVTNLRASYRSPTPNAPGHPELLDLAATLGGGVSQGSQLALRIPQNLFDSVAVAASDASESTASPAVTGSKANGWTVTFTSPSAADRADFAATLLLGSTAVSPWLGYRGPGFTLTATTTATNAPGAGSSAVVAASPKSTFAPPVERPITGDHLTQLVLKVDGIGLAPDDRGAVGAYVLTVRLSPSRPIDGTMTPPSATKLANGWEPVPSGHEVGTDGAGDRWVMVFRTTHVAHTARTGHTADRLVDFSATLNVEGAAIDPASFAQFALTTSDDRAESQAFAIPISSTPGT